MSLFEPLEGLTERAWLIPQDAVPEGESGPENVPDAMIRFWVAGDPKTAGSKKAFVNPKTGRAIITDDSGRPGREWRSDVRAAAQEAIGDAPPLDGPLALSVIFFVRRPRGHYGTGRNASQLKDSAPAFPAVIPDLTKMLRAVEDALKGLAWGDDKQVVDQLCAKRYAAEGRVGALVVIQRPKPGFRL